MPKDNMITTAHLIPLLDQHLIHCLRSLNREDWEKQTIAPAWKVRDVAAHLLDGNIRSLSSSRDHHFGQKHPVDSSYGSVVSFLNELNADWVRAMDRTSPEVLTDLLEITNNMYSDHLGKLPLLEKSLYAVAWAGEAESMNWFHIAREYTEKWHHQQQIRDAVGGPSPLFDEMLFRPYLDTSLRALPFVLKSVPGEENDTFSIFISGAAPYEYHLMFRQGSWSFMEEQATYGVTKIRIDDRVIWRVFSGQISDSELRNRTYITGKTDPAEAFLRMRAVMV